MEANWTATSENLLKQMFPLHRACRDGDMEILTSLLSAGEVDLYEEDDFYGWTPIHWAAYFGKLQCLMYILEYGGNCDASTERLNQSPSHIAAYGGHCHCLKWLLHCGASMNRQLACLRRLVNILESASIAGCDLATSKYSQTPVHLCAFGGHPQCLYWLAQCRSDLNAKDYMGETPIHKAARTGSMECVSLLVSQGANLSLKNYSGHTASQVAMTAGYPECASYLERAAAIQCQTMGMTPAETTQPSLQCNGTNPAQQQQPSVQTHFISTNTYHSHPHVVVEPPTTHHHPHMQNGLNNNHDDCDMEMEDGSHDTAHSQSNHITGFHQEVPNGDILLHQGVSQNVVPLAGKKRGREETEEPMHKRARQDDYVYEERNRFVFAELPFANDISDNMSSMDSLDCNHQGNWSNQNENVAPSLYGYCNYNNLGITGIQMTESELSNDLAPEQRSEERGHLGEINHNRQEPFSCVKFRDPPVKYCGEPKCKHLNGWFVNNGHMVSQLTNHMGDHVTNHMGDHVTNHMGDQLTNHMGDHVTHHMRSQSAPVSDSMVEHYTSVSMQQGYDSMLYSAMAPE